MTLNEDIVWARWSEIDPLFAAALELPASRRARFLAEQCGEDRELYRAVVSLLDDSGSLPRAPAGPGSHLLRAWSGDGAESPEIGLGPGDTVGRYRITGELGRGGMATVFEAERADGVYTQRVALKVLRRGLDTEEVVRRFHDERHILSELSHPNVAALLDGGATTDGRPFLVMQRVDGEPITAWADAHKLDVPARVRLFLQVVEAVTFAHRRLVVHRDIKPSNVLVDGQGRVVLLDFGIARLLDPADGPQRKLTRTGSLLLTPEYASPEQARGDAVTTGSDVYQLGILLYLLLAGRPPYPDGAPWTSGPTGRHEPLPPSEAVGQDQPMKRRRLKGDLDTIVRKAMQPEVEERYGSAEALADDLRRHLHGRPIRARPPSAAYRLKKFARRNPWFPPVAAVLVLMAAGYVGTLELHARRLEGERNIARVEAERAEQLRTFLVDLFQTADPYQAPDPARGRSITVVEALDLGAERARSELADRPALRADLLSSIGAVYERLDLREPALELVGEALETRAGIGEARSAGQLADLGPMASLLALGGQLDSATAVARTRLELAREMQPQGAAMASSLLGLAAVDYTAGRHDEALDRRLEAVAILRELGPAHQGALADALAVLADSHRALNQLDRSEAVAREGLELQRTISGDDHPSTTLAAVHLAQLLHARDRFDDAAQLYRSSIPRLEAALGPLHLNTINALNNFGIVLTDAGDTPGAEEVQRQVLERRRRIPGGDTLAVATSLQNLATTVLLQGRLGEADSLAAAAEELYGRLLPTGHALQAFPILTRTEIRLRRGDGEDAERRARQASAILSAALPSGHYATAVADCRIGAALALQNRRAEAETIMREALAVLETDPRTPARMRVECSDAVTTLTDEITRRAEHD
jgi:eukaryotic-like serine/threonine-protein kinase